MACVALTSLMATIQLEFLQPNSRLSLVDEASMKSFYRKLSCLQGIVQKKSGGGAAIRDLEIKIRDYALHAEDCIEIQLSNFLLAKDMEDQQKASQQLHQTLKEAAENAAELLKASNNISNQVDDDDDDEVVNETQPAWNPWLKHAPEPYKHSPMLALHGGMVGRRRDHTLVTDELLRQSSSDIEVIPIVGMAGIGKTTLAKSVYNDPTVASHFEVRGWVSMMSGEYNKTQTLHHLLWALAEAGEIKMGGIIPDDLAAKQVHKFLKGKRYLIVFDNFWNNQAWVDIQQCFPSNGNGSHIVITTTHFSSRNCVFPYSYIHNMTLLNPEESWDLFGNNLFLEQHTMASKFEKIRSQIVEKCEGLPHTIVVVRERLSKCDNIAQEWKKVEKELELLGVLDSRTLTLTYNQLPQHLKVCFLYFGVFPKRSAIKVKQLISLWIAEGFLNPEDGGLLEPWKVERLQKQAYEYYLQEFIDRSLILIDNWSFDRKIKTCRMHSALHSFCVRQAQKEGIFCAVNIEQHLQWGSFNMFENSCRWFSLYKHSFDYYVLFKTNTPRSVLFFQDDVEISIPFKLLRVLAFTPSSFLQRLPTHLRELVFLRYLSVKEWFEGLDYIVSINHNLQVLVISNNESQLGAPILHLPSTVWELPQLHHLELGNLYVIDPPSVKKENMQTLSWMCPTHGGIEVHRMFPNIKKLKIFVSCSIPIILNNLDYLKHLERLSILVSFGCVVTLPKLSMIVSQLKKLRLNGTSLSKNDLMVIGKLPRLMVLKLENAIHGEVWEVAEGEFYELKFLLLEDKKLKQWRADDYSFPSLKHLVLRSCCCLKEIPRAMSKIYSLKLFELEHCRPSVIASAKHIKECQHDSGNSISELKIKGPEYDDEAQCTAEYDDESQCTAEYDDESQSTHIGECSYTSKCGCTIN